MCKPESSAEDARFNGGTMTSGGESSLSLPPQSNGVFRLVIPYIPFLINLSKAAAYKTTCHEYCWIPFRFYLLLTCHAKLRHGPSLLIGQHLLRLIDLFVRCAHAMPFTLPPWSIDLHEDRQHSNPAIHSQIEQLAKSWKALWYVCMWWLVNPSSIRWESHSCGRGKLALLERID